MTDKIIHRLLDKGEIIKKGDEFDSCRDGWRDKPKWKKAKNRIGQPVPDPAYPAHTIYRRILKEAK